MSDTRLIAVVPLTDENRAQMAEFALSMYLGERCPYCLGVFATMANLEHAVWNGYTEHGRIAHRDCFRAAHPEWQPEMEVPEP